MINEIREHEELLGRKLQEQKAICGRCMHRDNIGHGACIKCDTDSKIVQITEEIRQIEKGLEEL